MSEEPERVAGWGGAIPAAETWRMEQYSRAYVKAVGSVVRCSVDWATVDNDSVDGTLIRRTTDTPVKSPRLDFQLKATSVDCIGDRDVAFQLPIKNYTELRDERLAVPRILVVVVMPPLAADWLDHSESALAMKKCGYWLSLRGAAETRNTSSVTVKLPRAQQLDPAGLDALFTRLQTGGMP